MALSRTDSPLTESEHLFYAVDKRHTGGWCGPGQRITTSVVSPAYGSLARSADGSPVVLAPAPCPADQGPGVR